MRPIGETEFANGVAAMSASSGQAGARGSHRRRRWPVSRHPPHRYLEQGPGSAQPDIPARPQVLLNEIFQAGLRELALLGLTFGADHYMFEGNFPVDKGS